MSQIQQSGAPKNISSTGTVSVVNCTLVGFYVNSTSSGTLVLRQGAAGTSAGTVISGTITPAVGFHCFPAYCTGGLHATIANTLDVTFFFAAG
jgi:hypothetical protein